MNIRQKASYFLNDNFILHTAFVFLGITAGGVFHFLYHLFAGRMLSTEDFGTFNTLISLVIFLSILIIPLSITLTRYFTEFVTKKEFCLLKLFFTKIIKILAIVSFIMFLVFLALAQPSAQFLKTKTTYIIICGAIIAFLIFSLSFTSLFQSFQMFKTFSFIWIVSSLGKLILGSLFLYLNRGVLTGLLGFLTGPILIILISLFFIPNIFKIKTDLVDKKDVDSINLTPVYKYFFVTFIATLSYAILTNIDVILVKHFFTPVEVGYYSIAQLVGKITIFLPSAITVAISPKNTEAFIRNKPSLKLFYKSLFLGGICCFFITILSFMFPEIILKILIGKVNYLSIGLVGLFSLAMSFYALLWIVINFSLAIHNLKFVLPLLLISFLQAAFIYKYHPSLTVVLHTILFFSITSLTACLFILKITHKEFMNKTSGS